MNQVSADPVLSLEAPGSRRIGQMMIWGSTVDASRQSWIRDKQNPRTRQMFELELQRLYTWHGFLPKVRVWLPDDRQSLSSSICFLIPAVTDGIGRLFAHCLFSLGAAPWYDIRMSLQASSSIKVSCIPRKPQRCLLSQSASHVKPTTACCESEG